MMRGRDERTWLPLLEAGEQGGERGPGGSGGGVTQLTTLNLEV